MTINQVVPGRGSRAARHGRVAMTSRQRPGGDGASRRVRPTRSRRRTPTATASIRSSSTPATTRCARSCTPISVAGEATVRYDWTSGPGGGHWSERAEFTRPRPGRTSAGDCGRSRPTGSRRGAARRSDTRGASSLLPTSRPTRRTARGCARPRRARGPRVASRRRAPGALAAASSCGLREDAPHERTHERAASAARGTTCAAAPSRSSPRAGGRRAAPRARPRRRRARRAARASASSAARRSRRGSRANIASCSRVAGDVVGPHARGVDRRDRRHAGEPQVNEPQQRAAVERRCAPA